MTWRIAPLALLGAASIALAAWFWYAPSPLVEARRALQDGNYALALRFADAQLEKQPNDQRALLLEARAYARWEHWPEAEAVFSRVPLSELEDFRLRERGLWARSLWAEAAQVNLEILKRWPDDVHALEQLTKIRLQQERYQEALTLAKQLSRAPSRQLVGYVLIGMIELQFTHYPAAADAFEAATRISPDLMGSPVDPVLVLEWLAEALLTLGRSSDAELHAARAREQSKRPQPCWLLGRAREQQGDDEGARRYWEEAVVRDPKFFPALRDLGRMHFMFKRPILAVPWLERAHEINPDDQTTIQILRAVYRTLGEHEKLDKLLKEQQEQPGEQP